MRSFQGNAVSVIKNDLSQRVKVHNFVSFPTMAGSSLQGCVLPFRRGSQVCTWFPSLPSSGRQQAPTTTLDVLSAWLSDVRDLPKTIVPYWQSQAHTQVLWLWHQGHFPGPKSSLYFFNLSQNGSQSMVHVPKGSPHQDSYRGCWEIKTIFRVTLRSYLPPSLGWYLHFWRKGRSE